MNTPKNFWPVCGWAAAVLSQLVFWSIFFLRHDEIIMSPGNGLHPAYTAAQVDAMLAQGVQPYDTLFAVFADLLTPFLFFSLLFVIYEVHLSRKAPHAAPLAWRLGIVAAGLVLMQVLIRFNYNAEYYLLYMHAEKVLVVSLVWFAMCLAEGLAKRNGLSA